MKPILTILITLLLSTNIYAADIYSVIDEYTLDNISISANQDFKSLFQQILDGEFTFSDITASISSALFKEISGVSAILKGIIFICILNGIINTMAPNNISAFTITHILALAMCMSSLKISMNLLSQTVTTVISIMESSMPAVLSLLVINGYSGGAGMYGIFMYGFIDFLSVIVRSVVLPCISFYTVSAVINSISPKSMLTRLGQLFYKICVWSVRVLALVFNGVLAFLKIYMTGIDGTAKKALGEGIKAVPVVGDIFSGSIGTLAQLTTAAKSGFGLALTVSILVAAAIPLVKVLVLMLIYKTAAALAEPISDKGIVEIIDCVGDTHILILGVMFLVIFMFVTGTFILIYSGG